MYNSTVHSSTAHKMMQTWAYAQNVVCGMHKAYSGLTFKTKISKNEHRVSKCFKPIYDFFESDLSFEVNSFSSSQSMNNNSFNAYACLQ